MQPSPTIGLVELTELGLFDGNGRNRAAVRRGSALTRNRPLTL